MRETAGCYQSGETARMPPEDVNESMIVLEDAIENGVAADGACYALSSRTGNGLKELNYYVHERDAFLERFNAALAGQPRFPIEMTFYHDPEWQELQLTRAKFDEAEG